jgi:hypothetical protein
MKSETKVRMERGVWAAVGMAEMGVDVGGESRDGGRRSTVGGGRASYGERARCCDPARAGAARARQLSPRLPPALICGSADALVRQVDLAHHNTSL